MIATSLCLNLLKIKFIFTNCSIVIMSKPFKCAVCSTYFTRKDNLTRHEQKHNNEICRCNSCDITFSRIDALKRHYFTIHESEKKIFPCEKCNKEFNRKDNLVRHMKNQHFASTSLIQVRMDY